MTGCRLLSAKYFLASIIDLAASTRDESIPIYRLPGNGNPGALEGVSTIEQISTPLLISLNHREHQSYSMAPR